MVKLNFRPFRPFRLFASSYWIALINLSLAALLGYTATDFALSLYKPLPVQKIRAPLAARGSVAEGTVRALDVSPLVSVHLFGRANAVKTPEKKVFAAPDTNLNLVLQGTLASSERSNAKAVIAAPGGKGEEYSIGKSLPGGAILQDVHPDYVILLRNNRYETLRLAGRKADSRQAAAAEASPPPTELGKKLGDYRRQILNKPSSFAKLLRIKPAVKNGALIGYRVLPGRDAAAFTALGLQHGDILTSVNGTALESSIKGLSVLQQLTDAKHVDVEILRNGMSLSLSFTIED